MNDTWDYKIDGKTGSLARLIIMFVISAIFIGLSFAQLKTNDFNFTIVLFFFGSIAVISLGIFLKLLIRYFCFKVYIGKKGFYFQSNPFNGKYYEYSDIANCYEELMSSKESNGPDRVSMYYFTFKDENGKTIKFQFEKALHEREINELKSRIKNK